MPLIGPLTGQISFNDILIFFGGQSRAELLRRRCKAGYHHSGDDASSLAYYYPSISYMNGMLSVVVKLDAWYVRTVILTVSSVNGVAPDDMDESLQRRYLLDCLDGVAVGQHPWGMVSAKRDPHAASLSLQIEYKVSVRGE